MLYISQKATKSNLYRQKREKMATKIKKLQAREILDSRGLPTVECILELTTGAIVAASVPSGTSVGKHEALELRDNDKSRYLGNGVLQAIDNIQMHIAPHLINKQPILCDLDQLLIDLDGTENKGNFGANATLAVSIAVARAQAITENMELYLFLNKLFAMGKLSLPFCMFNIINGGLHAHNHLAFQEFMIMPQSTSIRQTLQIASEVYHTLKKVLKDRQLSVTVGEEGGFAPLFTNEFDSPEQQALELLSSAIQRAEFSNKQIPVCLDVAASHFYDAKTNTYNLNNAQFDSKGMINLYAQLAPKYNIISIEDGMAEDDWYGWQLLTERKKGKIQIVGDDIFVTNPTRIEKGITLGVANAVLIKPNQIGTISETITAIKLCKQAEYKTVISHRSGETNDTFIADLVVATGAGQFKAGAPARGERVAKYNRLLEIEDTLSI